MAVLHTIYGLFPKDTRYRSKLKSRILSEFQEELYFLVVNNKTPEVIINAEAIDSHTLFNSRDHIIKQTADYLREDIIKLAKETPELRWPITMEELNKDRRQPTESVISILECLLKSKDHPNRDRVSQLISSYSADMINGVTRGKFVTSKHFLLGLGIHNITGQKKPVQILNHLGHCIGYDLVCEVETAQAEKAQVLASKDNFTLLGNIVKGSGFEDTVVQANLCSSGSLNGVLNGNHYNRAWTVHATFSEALERLLTESDSSRKVVLKKDSKARSIEANCGILGSLIAVSTRAGQVIDFQKALKYPLSSVLLILANPDADNNCTRVTHVAVTEEEELTTDQRTCALPDLSTLGWTDDLQIKWIKSAFPAEVEELLFDANDEDFYGEEDESKEDEKAD
eukprot:gene18445-biopygen15542